MRFLNGMWDVQSLDVSEGQEQEQEQEQQEQEPPPKFSKELTLLNKTQL